MKYKRQILEVALIIDVICGVTLLAMPISAPESVTLFCSVMLCVGIFLPLILYRRWLYIGILLAGILISMRDFIFELIEKLI